MTSNLDSEHLPCGRLTRLPHLQQEPKRGREMSVLRTARRNAAPLERAGPSQIAF